MIPREYLNLSLFWLPINLFWGGMLLIVLQWRVEHFVPHGQLPRAFAIIMGIGAAVSTITQLFIGPLSDNCTHPSGRRKPFVVTGTLLTLVPIAAFALAPSFAILVLAFVGIQIFINVANGPYQALIPDNVSRAEHGRASAYMGIAQVIGQALGPALAGILLSEQAFLWKELDASARKERGLQAFLTISAFSLLIAMIHTTRSVPDRPQAKDEALSISESLRDSFRLGLSKYPDFTWLLVSRFFINLGFYTAMDFFQPFMRYTLKVKDPNYETMILGLLTTVCSLVSTFPAGILADRVSKRAAVVVSCSTCVVAALLFAFTESLTMARVAAVIFGLGFGAFAVVDWAFACNLMPKDREAKYMAIWHFSFTVPQVLAPVIVAPLVHYVNEYVGGGAGWRAALWTLIVYLTVGMLLIRNVRELKADEAVVEAASIA